MDNTKLWEQVLMGIELQVSRPSFTTWFKGTHIVRVEDGAVTVGVPNAFVRDWLTNKYHKVILHSLRELAEGIRSLEYAISKDEPHHAAFERPRAMVPGELPLGEFYINKDDNLNPRYTFDTFVVGSFNEVAHAASQAVIKRPGVAYNPLFVYGSTGHGKTHLIQSIGNYLKKEATKRVFYMTSEKFALEYTTAVQTNHINQFKEKYRKYDALIMDDIQFLSSKESTQEELFHLFNTLYENNRQIVFSSDKHPNFIPNLKDRLKSRFAQGMIVDIPPPDHESRVAILRLKAQMSGFGVSDEILEYLATTIEGNVRELEGTLNTLLCQTQIKGRDLTVPEVKNIIKSNAKPRRNVSIKDVVKIIADFYKIEEASIFEKTRRKEVVRPRQLTMYILREDFSVSYPSIGQKMGGRDHTTVIHSCEKIKSELKFNHNLAQELTQIRAIMGP